MYRFDQLVKWELINRDGCRTYSFGMHLLTPERLVPEERNNSRRTLYSRVEMTSKSGEQNQIDMQLELPSYRSFETSSSSSSSTMMNLQKTHKESIKSLDERENRRFILHQKTRYMNNGLFLVECFKCYYHPYWRQTQLYTKELQNANTQRPRSLH